MRDGKTWKALADPIRREILDTLRGGPETTGTLADRFPVSRYAVMKHLGVLHEAGLIRYERRGKERWNYLNAVPIQRIYRRWIRPFEAGPADQLLRLERHLENGRTDREESAMSNEELETAKVIEVKVEIDLGFTPERVWKGLTEEIGEWMPDVFYAGGEPGKRTYTMQAEPGGWMGERWDDGGGVLWATVLAVHPHRRLEVRGDVSPAWGGPGSWIGSWELEPDGDGTRLTFTDSAVGRVGDRYREEKEKGWSFLFDRALRAHLAGDDPPEWVD